MLELVPGTRNGVYMERRRNDRTFDDDTEQSRGASWIGTIYWNLLMAPAYVSLILWYVSIDFDVQTVETIVERGRLVGARFTTGGTE